MSGLNWWLGNLVTSRCNLVSWLQYSGNTVELDNLQMTPFAFNGQFGNSKQFHGAVFSQSPKSVFLGQK